MLRPYQTLRCLFLSLDWKITPNFTMSFHLNDYLKLLNSLPKKALSVIHHSGTREADLTSIIQNYPHPFTLVRTPYLLLKLKLRMTEAVTNYPNDEDPRPIPHLLTLLMENWGIRGLTGDLTKRRWRNTCLNMLCK